MTDELHRAWNVTTDAWQSGDLRADRHLAWTETTNRSARTCTVNSLRRPPGTKPSLCFPTSNKALTHFPSKRSLGFTALALATIHNLIFDVLSDDHLLCDTQAKLQVSAHAYIKVIHYKRQNGHLGSTSQLLVTNKARLCVVWGGAKTITLICSNSG